MDESGITGPVVGQSVRASPTRGVMTLALEAVVVIDETMVNAPDKPCTVDVHRRRLARELARAVRGFDMLSDGDRVLVAMSGGKDSYVLFHLLDALRKRAPIRFCLVPVHVDQGHPGHDPAPLIEYVASAGYELHVERDNTYERVVSQSRDARPSCSMCARFRRAILYRLSDELGCTKIALGHHRDDAVVTLMLNLVFEGQLKSMPPKLLADDGKHVVIRPLIYCSEDELRELCNALGCPIVSCVCCDAMPEQNRKTVSQMLASFEKLHPGLRQSMLAALANVRPSHLLDVGLWRKLGLHTATETASSAWNARALPILGDGSEWP